MARPKKEITGKGKLKRNGMFVTDLKVGDSVMVLGGGNSKKEKVLRGKVGKILRFLPKKSRVIIDGLNFVKRHRKAQSANEPAGIISKEGSVHISNVMYYHNELKRPVRIKHMTLDDGRKVRAFKNPTSKKLEPLDV